jgi:hypothetical protein
MLQINMTDQPSKRARDDTVTLEVTETDASRSGQIWKTPTATSTFIVEDESVSSELLIADSFDGAEFCEMCGMRKSDTVKKWIHFMSQLTWNQPVCWFGCKHCLPDDRGAAMWSTRQTSSFNDMCFLRSRCGAVHLVMRGAHRVDRQDKSVKWINWMMRIVHRVEGWNGELLDDTQKKNIQHYIERKWPDGLPEPEALETSFTYIQKQFGAGFWTGHVDIVYYEIVPKTVEFVAASEL